MEQEPPKKAVTRRNFLRRASLLALGALGGSMVARTLALPAGEHGGRPKVWQIDPHKCIQCGNCATYCVLGTSAVKCVHAFTMCGYCELCFGYFRPRTHNLDTGAENQLCPTGALIRTYVDAPYYQYEIDKELCIGCGKCVKGCTTFGNGSLSLQVQRDRCLDCNECSIAAACPSDAFVRVDADQPYILKDRDHEG